MLLTDLPPIAALKDRCRLLLVLAPSPKGPSYEKQMQLIRGEDTAFKERDLVLGCFFRDAEGRIGKQTVSAEDGRSAHEAAGLREDGFAVLLIGKDGTEKNRYDAPVMPEAIYRLIDGMPARREETHREDRRR